MSESFSTSESTAKLDVALAKVQAEVKSAERNRENPFYKSRYADLAAIYDACREALSNHGVNVTQWPVHAADDRLHLVTRVGHEGEWMMAEASAPVTKPDVQGYGSALTYFRRYALTSLLGIAAEDDDGQAATEGQTKAKPAAKKAPKLAAVPETNAPATGKQMAELSRRIKERNIEPAFASWLSDKHWKKNSAADLTFAEADAFADLLAGASDERIAELRLQFEDATNPDAGEHHAGQSE